MYFWEATEIAGVCSPIWRLAQSQDWRDLLKQKPLFLPCIWGDFLHCVWGLACPGKAGQWDLMGWLWQKWWQRAWGWALLVERSPVFSKACLLCSCRCMLLELDMDCKGLEGLHKAIGKGYYSDRRVNLGYPRNFRLIQVICMWPLELTLHAA